MESSETPQATRYEAYQATQKLAYAWGQILSSFEVLTQRLERLDCVVNKTGDRLGDCHLALQKRLLAVDDDNQETEPV